MFLSLHQVNPGALTPFGSDTRAIMRLLEQYNVTPDYILQRAPSFFSCSGRGPMVTLVTYAHMLGLAYAFQTVSDWIICRSLSKWGGGRDVSEVTFTKKTVTLT